MSFVDPNDVATKGFLKPSQLESGTAYRLKVLDYKREKGGKFPDKDGYSTSYVFEVLDKKLADIANEDGTVIMNCNSKRLRSAFLGSDINIGDVVDLTQKGKGFDTKYEITKVETGETVSAEDIQ